MNTITLCTVCCARTSGTVHCKNATLCSDECYQVYLARRRAVYYDVEQFDYDEFARMVNTYDHARRVLNSIRTRKAKKTSSSLKKQIFEPQMFGAVADKLSAVSGVVEGIQDVAKAIHRCALEGISVPVDIAARLDAIVGGVSDLNRNIDKITTDGVSIRHEHELSLNNFFSWIIENRNTVGVFVLTFVICCLCFSGKTAVITSLVSLIGAFLTVSDVSGFLSERWNHLKRMLELNNQGAFEPQGLEASLPKALLLFGYLTIFKTVDFGIMTEKFNSVFNAIGRAPVATDRVIDTITVYATLCQNLINETLTWIGVDKQFNWFGDKYPAVSAVVAECNAFLEQCSSNSTDLIVSRAAQTSQVLQNQVTNLLVKYKADKDFIGSSRLLYGCKSRLEALDKELDLRGAGRSVTRVAPKAFLFMGKPGIGKSYLLRTLCTMLLYKLFANDPVALKRIEAGQTRDFIFTRNSDDKFWEGYYNQTIVYLDEVAMTRDVAGSNSETNEYSSFIKMVNDVTFPLPMANVEKKGMCEFDSDIILGTTNAMNFDIQSINNRDAYDRRWIKLEVEVNPEYGYLYNNTEFACGGSQWVRPDFNIIRQKMSVEEVALSSFLRFRERRSLFRCNEYVGEWMDIHELIERMKSEVSLRETEKIDNKNHMSILKSIFSVKKEEEKPEKIAGAFEPQGLDCPCKVCQGSIDQCFTSEEKFFYSSKLGVPFSTFETAFKDGYAKVEKENDFFYNTSPICIQDLLKTKTSFEAIDIAFSHGHTVKSLMLKKTIYDPVDAQKDYFVSILKKASIFIGLVMSSIGLYKMISYFTSKDEEVVADAPKTIVPQLLDLNAQEVLGSVLKRNVYAVGCNVMPLRGFITFIKDNIFVAPRHFIINWREDIISGKFREVNLRRLGDNINHQIIRFDPSIFLRDELMFTFGDDEDLCAFYLDNRVMQKHASIRPYLMPGKTGHKYGEAILPIVDFDSLRYGCTSVSFTSQSMLPIAYEVLGQELHVKDPIIYKYNTRKGDCGLPVAIKDPSLRKEKIFGIHVSGAPTLGTGISTSLTVEKFDAICEYFSGMFDLIQAQYRTEASVLLDMQKEGKGWNDLFAVPEYLEVPGKVNLGYLEPPMVPVKTSIVPSPLFKKVQFTPKTKPAWLRPFIRDGERIDPNAIATAKYHHSVEAFNLPLLDVCKNSVTDIVLNNPMIQEDEAMGRRVLTFEESVEGIAGVEGFDGIPRRTSAGYPRCKYVEGKGKRDFFGDCGDYEFDSFKAQEIRANVENIIASAKQGIRGNHVFLDFPKDERRPKLKADSGKTRKISACPIDLAICIRQYFGCFVQFFMKNRIFNQSAVGVNVFDKQWETIAKYLGVDSRVIAGDFSNYDGKLPYCVMIRFLDTVTDFYGDRGSESERVRDVLFQELVNSRHIMNGAVYEWVGSNASGNPLTTVLNSWCNLVLLRYAALKCVKIKILREAKAFMKNLDSHTRFMVYGDDNLISVRRNSEYAPYLTQQAFTDAFEEMGLEYTDESKSGGMVDQDRSITDVSFLKRKWAKNSVSPMRTYLSPLDLNTILESIQWTKKKDVLLEAVKNNVENMLQELSQHDRETFDEWAPKIISACKEEMNFVPLPNTYNECQLTVLSRDMSF